MTRPGLTPEVLRVVDLLEAVPSDDPERAHGAADDIVLAHVHPAINEAYIRVMNRCSWWGAA